MTYYSEDNEILDTQEFEYFDSGGCANIYKNGDTLLKVYKYDCNYRYFLGKKMFRLIKTSNIPNMVKLLDLYHRSNNLLYKKLPLDAYTMEMVKGKRVTLINQKRDYLRDVISQLEETINGLCEKKILLEDPSAQNIIFKEDGVTIIDPDQFLSGRFLSKTDIYTYNKNQVIQYINRTISEESNVKSYYYVTPIYKSSLTRDFNLFLKEETINETIQKKLSKSI